MSPVQQLEDGVLHTHLQIVYDLQWIPRMVDLDIIGYNGLSSDLDKPMCKPIRISGFGDVAIDGTYCLQYESSIGLHYF